MNWKECGRIGRSLKWGSTRLPARMDHDQPVRMADLVKVRRRYLPNTKQWCCHVTVKFGFLTPHLCNTNVSGVEGNILVRQLLGL